MLSTADGTQLKTHGTKIIEFRIANFKQKFSWKFHIAEVIRPILGMDFLETYGFILDCDTRTLSIEDKATRHYTKPFSQITPVNSILRHTNEITKRAKTLVQNPTSTTRQTELSNSNNSNVSTQIIPNDKRQKNLANTTDEGTNAKSDKPRVKQKINVNTVEKIIFSSTMPQNIINLIKKFPNLSTRSKNFFSKHSYKHSIIITESHPLRERVRPLSIEKLESVRQEFTTLEADGIIRRSSSPWASPLHVVPKKDGSFRPCGDYRRLNKITVHDAYPMPLVNDILHRFPEAHFFSTLDLTKAYHQIPMNPDDIQKTAVITPFGLFEYMFMPFGLRNAAQTFQRHIDQILFPFNYCLAYIDDVIIGSPDLETHLKHLEQIFTVLNDNNLQINIDKCVFAEKQVKFLGHLISNDGLSPLPSRMDTIQNFPLPKTVTNLRSFLGTINYCHRFIPNVSDILAPLSALTTGPKQTPIEWTKETYDSFESAKLALCKMQTLAHFTPNLPIRLTTDASNFAIGAVLQQIINKTLRPLEFFSKKLSTTEQRYATFDRELLAIFLSVKHFKHLLEGRPFTIQTDHKPLTHIFNMKNPSPRQQRQISFLSQFSCTIEYIAGKTNIIADCLSRIETCSITHSPLFDSAILTKNPPSQADLHFFKDKHVITDGIHFDTSIPGTFRPILHENLRKEAFKAIHNLHHPGASSTFEILHTKVIWPQMRADIKLWVSECQLCQKHKISRYIKPPFQHFPTGNRFDIIHIDLVGPLPVDNGFSYLLTMIDRKTRWFEAIPLKTITADNVAQHIIQEWFSRYGIPRSIITDRGTQFESQLFNSLSKTLGISHFRTTAYHPQTNGMIERLHRTLKTSLSILSTSTSWTRVLPYVLLGWRNTPSRTTGSSPAQLLFGTSLASPNELIDFQETPLLEELNAARNFFLSIDSNPQFTLASSYKPYIPKNFNEASHAWIRTISDSNLKPRYNGPFRILNILGNHASLEINGKSETISLTRLKPAFGIQDDVNIPVTNILPETFPPISPFQPTSIHEAPSTETLLFSQPSFPQQPTADDTLPASYTQSTSSATEFLPSIPDNTGSSQHSENVLEPTTPLSPQPVANTSESHRPSRTKRAPIYFKDYVMNLETLL